MTRLTPDMTSLKWTSAPDRITWPKIAVADFDADGFDDIAIGTFMDWIGYTYYSGLTVFINDNIGHFKSGKRSKFDIERRCNIDNQDSDCKHIILSGDPVITDIQTADIDGDGFVDIIATWPHLPLIAWSRNSGGGSFETLRTISNNTRAYSLVALDIDYDGSIDVVAGSFGRNSTTKCEKVFDEDKPFERIYDPGGGVIENCSALATCTLTCSRVPTIPSLCHPSNQDACDEYCKSIFEKVCRSKSMVKDSEVVYFKNHDNGKFHERPQVIQTVSRAFEKDDIVDILSVDVDSDGTLDLIVQTRSKTIWLENAKNNRSLWISHEVGQAKYPILIGNVGQSNDFYKPFMYSVQPGGPGPRYLVENILPRTSILVAGDIDNDGKIDIVSAAGYDGIVLFKSVDSTGTDWLSSSISISCASYGRC